MRIPLDYYQILAIVDDVSELDRAYQDRLEQLPRQGYSEAAIDSRKQLITIAYQALSDPARRAEYTVDRLSAVPGEIETAAELSHTALTYSRRPELEIAPEHFLGGLLILFELGEYEEVNSICMPYLGNNGRSSNSGSLHPHLPAQLTPSGNLSNSEAPMGIEPAAVSKLKRTRTGTRVIPLRPDIVLTMIFSFLELGDREGRNGCYEEAVVHFETAQKILVQEDLFPQIQGQIDRRLDRLLPYRVASLVALPLERHEQRGQGIQFLEELLECACIDEVLGQERFGLNSEQTIQFIHETIPALTAAEQRNLFTQVARDSYQESTNTLNIMQLACTYLQVHALIAQGFAYRNPQSIYTAQQILEHRLSQRLEVTTIDRAICALLLGQTEEAISILDTIAESAALIAIRQQSQGHKDLLRGLCWYIESWFKDHVFPCFRDLVDTNSSIHDYFDDHNVQEFADRVPAVAPNVSSWADSVPQSIDVPPSGDLSGRERQDRFDESKQLDSANTKLVTTTNLRRSSKLNPQQQAAYDRVSVDPIAPALRVEQFQSVPTQFSVLLEPDDAGNNIIQLEQERQRRRPSLPTARTLDGEFEVIGIEDNRHYAAFIPEISSQLVTTNRVAGNLMMTRFRRRQNIRRIIAVGTSGIACLWGIGWIGNEIWHNINKLPSMTTAVIAVPSPEPSQGQPVATQPVITQPVATQPSPQPIPQAVKGVLSANLAQQTIQNWLSAKAKSLNLGYQTAELKNVLVEPALSGALERAQTAQANGIHWEYTHPQVQIATMPQLDALAQAATVRVVVTENASYFDTNRRLNPARSYAKKLMVDYNLVRQGDRWYVKDMDVVKTVGDG